MPRKVFHLTSPDGRSYQTTSAAEVTSLRARGYQVAPEARRPAPVPEPDPAPAPAPDTTDN